MTIAGNRVRNTHAEPGSGGTTLGVDPASVIWLARVDDATIADCAVEDLGPHGVPDKPVVLGKDAKDVKGRPTLETAR